MSHLIFLLLFYLLGFATAVVAVVAVAAVVAAIVTLVLLGGVFNCGAKSVVKPII